MHLCFLHTGTSDGASSFRHTVDVLFCFFFFFWIRRVSKISWLQSRETSPISNYCDSWSSKMNGVFNNQTHVDSALRQTLSQLSRPETRHTRKRQRKRKVGLGFHIYKSCHVLIISVGMRHLSTQKNKMRGYHQVQMLVLQQSQHSLFAGWL